MEEERNLKAIVALVTGIISIIFFFLTLYNVVLGIIISLVAIGSGIIAIVFGVGGRKKAANKGMATAGFVCGIIGICICTFSLLGNSAQLYEIPETSIEVPSVSTEEDSYDPNEEEVIKEEQNDMNTHVEETQNDVPSMTIGQSNAVRKANSYLEIMAFSREGLIKQLEYEKYSTEDATYAVDHINADWNEQAVKKAKSYLDIMAFSKEGLISQLEYEGFTHAQAVYGVEHNGY